MGNEKRLLGFEVKVHIKNRAAREYKAKQYQNEQRKVLIPKIMQMAGIKKLSKSELYDMAEDEGLNRYLYKNTVRDLENFLEDLRDIKDVSE